MTSYNVNPMDIQARLLQSRQQLAINELGKSKDKRLAFWGVNDTEKYTTRKLCSATIIYDNPVPFLQTIPVEEIVGIDVETTGFNPKTNRIIGLGISSKSKQFFIWGKYSVMREALEWLTHNRVLTAHNFKFDGKFILHQLGLEIVVQYDTMILQHLDNSSLSKELASCAERYLNRTPLHFVELCRPHNPPHTKNKDLDINLVPIQEIGNYCAEDCLESALLVPIYLSKLTPNQIILHDIELGTQQLLIRTELTGIKFDIERAYKLSLENYDLLDIIVGEIYNLVGYEFNISSTQQLSKVLFEDLDLPTDGVSLCKSGFYSTSSEVLGNLDYCDVVKLVLEYRQTLKLTKDFCEKLTELANLQDGIIYTNYNQVGAVTGRLSSSQPNLQNIPNPNRSLLGRQIRSLFIARPNKVLVKADFSQFELRIIAHLSDEPYLINAFNSGEDVHAIVTELVFGIKYDSDNPLHKKYRTLTKNLNFGLAYGMSAMRLVSNAAKAGLPLSLERCEEIFKVYWQRLPGVARLFAQTKLETIVKGYSETLLGRRRYFNFTNPYLVKLNGSYNILEQNPISYLEYLESRKLIRFDDAAHLRECVNHRIQGTNADVIKLIMYQWYTQEYYKDAPVLLNVHDELVIECNEDESLFWGDTLRDTMQNSIKLKVPVLVEPSISQFWSVPQ